MAFLLDSMMQQYFQSCFCVPEDHEDGDKESNIADPLAGLPPCGFRRSPANNALPSTDRSALRLALCEQVFLQDGALHTGHVNFDQHKLGLIFVFEQLGDVPVPEDNWYVQVFQNFDTQGDGQIDFERFVDIVTQWDECCEERRKHLEALEAAADAVAADPPPSARVPNEVIGSSPSGIGAAPSNRPVGIGLDDFCNVGRSLSVVGEAGEEECIAALTTSETIAAPIEKQEPVQKRVEVEATQPTRRRFPTSGRWQPVQKRRVSSGRRWTLSSSGRSRSCSPSRSTAVGIAPEVRVPTHVGEHLVYKFYDFLRPLGEGAYGEVEMVCHKSTRQIRASKKVAISRPGQHEQVETEIALLKLLNHPNIMKLHEVYYDRDPALRECAGNVYLVTELCHGGDLLWRMAYHHVRIKSLMPEVFVAYIMRQILSAIRYCHGLGVMHRDIKPANILFMGNSPTSPVKVIDFGYAAFTQRIRQTAREKNVPRSGTLGRLARILPTVGGKELLSRDVVQQDMEAVGTSRYMAPELIAGCYDEKADLFSLGVVLCELLTGVHPFYTPKVDNEDSVKSKIVSKDPVVFPCAILNGDAISRQAQAFCLVLLQKNPRRRLSARQALSHPWFLDPSKPTPYGNIEVLSTSIFDALAKYKSYNKLKRAVVQLYSNDLPESEIQELCGKFMALDAQGDGLLSVDELIEAAARVGCELSPDELHEIVEALDASGQERIGYKEFAAALVERSLGLDELRLQECFRRLDGRGSGCISLEDVNKVLCSSDGATPGITESEWEEIVRPVLPVRQTNDFKSSSSMELTLEAFMFLMRSQEDGIEAQNPTAPPRTQQSGTECSAEATGNLRDDIAVASPQIPTTPQYVEV